MVKRPEKTVCWVFLLIGTGLMIGSFFWYKNQKEFLATASFGDGTVIEQRYISDSDGSGTYAPVVSFRTQRGETYKFTSSTSSNPPSFGVGEKVEVAYQDDNPLDAQINTFWELYLGVIILGGMGVFFAGFSMLALRMVEKSDLSIDQKVEEMWARMEASQSPSPSNDAVIKRKNDDWPDEGGPNSTVQRG